MSATQRISNTRRHLKGKETFSGSRPANRALECFEVLTSVCLSNFVSRVIKMAEIPHGITKGLVCFFLFWHFTCSVFSWTHAWDENWRHSWNNSLWTFPQHLSLKHTEVSPDAPIRLLQFAPGMGNEHIIVWLQSHDNPKSIFYLFPMLYLIVKLMSLSFQICKG